MSNTTVLHFLPQPAYPMSTAQIGCILLFGSIILIWAAVQFLSLLARLAGRSGVGAKICRGEDNLKTLNSSAEFAILLLVFFVCDRTDTFPRAEKHYDRDLFWFMWACLMLGAISSLQKVPQQKDAPEGHARWLSLEQTNEWKGWMQVQFLLYHYFHAAEIYNAIRLYIACYVWMTGFGNFSVYYMRGDFSFKRFFGTMWRLNFLVFWCCLLLANEYMLYYICMLHTLFTVIIFLAMMVKHHQNKLSRELIWAKFVLLFFITLVIWDLPNVFEIVNMPIRWLVDKDGSLKEWRFRSGLDHLVWIPGMITAFFHPNINDFMIKIDQMNKKSQYFIKGLIVTVILLIMKVYYDNVFMLPKSQYNVLHPYTSFIPITCYILLRNIFQTARRWHMNLFGWLGKITLETYIGQFHIWMLTTGPNGDPKKLLRILPEGYPMLNFALVSAFYILASYRLKSLTDSLKEVVMKFIPDPPRPHATPTRLAGVSVEGEAQGHGHGHAHGHGHGHGHGHAGEAPAGVKSPTGVDVASPPDAGFRG